MTTTIPYAYTLYGVEFNSAAIANNVVLNQISGTPISLNATVDGVPNSGNVYPNCLFLSDMRPSSSIETGNIYQALTTIGTEGQIISTGSPSYTGVVLYAQRLDKFKKRGTTGHRSFVISSGLVVPRSLSAGRDGSSFGFELYAVDNGSDPVAIVEGATLPTLPLTEAHYVLDKVTVGGVTLSGQTDVSIDFGVNVDVDKSGGKLFPNWCHISSITPRMTISGVDVDWIRTAGIDIDMFGRAAALADTIIYLKKRECGKTFYADNTSNHIKLAWQGKVQPQSMLSGSGKTMASITVTGNTNGTNAPIVVTTNTTIV